jgi:hypothetical protein
LFYLQAKKPEQISQLCQQFLLSARGLLTVPQGDPQHHLTIAASLTKLASYLDEFEQELYQAPYVIKPLQSAVSKLSMRFHWQDLFRFKQLLLHAAIQEHIYQIRLTPTDLEIHASLANAYVAISKLFAEPAQPAPLNEYRKNKEVYDQNFRTAAQLAVEEFQILHHYAPNDPWVHEQLAAGYRNLAMPEQEVQEIETLLRLRPQDKELLLRLGSLYFAQGMNAKGLRVYEDLKATHYKKAEDLIAAYGASDSARRMFDYL